MKTMKTLLIAALATTAVSAALAHNSMTEYYAPAGYMKDFEIRVTHGCQSSPVKEFRLKIPEGLMRVSVEHNRDWVIDVKMRKLPKPIPGEGGNMLTETVDEIIWKNPRSVLPASGRFEGFRFRGLVPNTPLSPCAIHSGRDWPLGTAPSSAMHQNAAPAKGAPGCGLQRLMMTCASRKSSSSQSSAFFNLLNSR